MSELADALTRMSGMLDAVPLDRLDEAARTIGKSWCGSWLGYQSRVYYECLQPVPPGARFSKEWGLMDSFVASRETVGNWNEYAFDDVIAAIRVMAGNPNLENIRTLAKEATTFFDESKSTLLSQLSLVSSQNNDPFLEDMQQQVKRERIHSLTEYLKSAAPTGQQMSRDMVAIQSGLQTPPHIWIVAETSELRSPFEACEGLATAARRLASHLHNRSPEGFHEVPSGGKVFIGHGRSHLWKDLKDFLQDRLQLPWDEFNRVPVAGIPNTIRLSAMLDDAAIAFLIMTAEDETSEGRLHARLNVVHEAGLFQGRLGFHKAIVLLEEGCEEFSNISGLGHIKFPKDNIAAAFEDIRRVLEREKLLDDGKSVEARTSAVPKNKQPKRRGA